jgi:hypothetical protein
VSISPTMVTKDHDGTECLNRSCVNQVKVLLLDHLTSILDASQCTQYAISLE